MSAAPLTASAQGGPPPGIRQDRVLVKPIRGVDLSVLHSKVGTRVLRKFPAIGNLQVVHVPQGVKVGTLLSAFRQSGLVQYAEPDFRAQALVTPNDPAYVQGLLWGLNNAGQDGGVPNADIDAAEGWDVQDMAPNVIVAVIDTGVRYTHQDLAQNMWINPGEIPGNGIDDDGDGYVDDVHGINAIDETGDPFDDHGHGTHVSGIIGAIGNNGVGVVGVCWKVQIMALKSIDSSANASISDAIECIDYARSHGARIINASWGSTNFTSTALRDAIDSVRQAGIIFVAACGNSAQSNEVNPIYPASYEFDNIISVAATTRYDTLADFSNYGATTVDLGAPGRDVLSCWNGSDSDYRVLSGTSMAAPHVVGACALLLAQNPNEDYHQILYRIFSAVDPLPDLAGKCVTGGRLNLRKALGGLPPAQNPIVTVVATDAQASEQGPDTGTFTVSRAGDTSSDLTVNYTLVGTAQNGTDYQQLGTSVIIPAGASAATVTVTPLDDSLVEGDESVILTLAASETYDIGSPNSATITIIDNDPPLALPTVTVAAADANAFAQGPDPATLIINRTGNIGSALTVHFSLGGSAIDGIDYQFLPTSVTIPQGAVSATLTVTPIDVNNIKADRTVVLALSPDAAYHIGSPGTATVTIADKPRKLVPTVTARAKDRVASEQGAIPGRFMITRKGDTTFGLTVFYSLGGTAVNGKDYEQLGTSVTIPAGARSAQVTVIPIDDSEVEGDETVVLKLSPDAAYAIDSAESDALIIRDNDAPPPRPGLSTITVVNAGGRFTINRTGNGLGSLVVRYTLGRSAANDPGYVISPGSVTIPAGATFVDVTGSDPLTDTGELLVLTISPDDAYNVGLPGTAVFPDNG